MKNLSLRRALGRAIRQRRTELGFSQDSFADHCGLHRTYIGAIERGERNLSLESLATVATALDTPLSSLIKEAERLEVGKGRQGK